MTLRIDERPDEAGGSGSFRPESDVYRSSSVNIVHHLPSQNRWRTLRRRSESILEDGWGSVGGGRAEVSGRHDCGVLANGGARN